MARTLDFFGRVTASATHEIKNSLAVLNEQSRLIQELLEAGGEGGGGAERLRELIGRVIARVEEADQTVRRLNAFAHSADLDRRAADAARSWEVIAPLFQRPAALAGCSLAAGPAPASAELACRPPVAQQAMWHCLEAAARAAEPGAEMSARVESRPGAAALVIRVRTRAEPRLPPPEVLEPLGAEVRLLAEGGLELVMPKA
jgi:signal transduction histidine kinase